MVGRRHHGAVGGFFSAPQERADYPSFEGGNESGALAKDCKTSLGGKSWIKSAKRSNEKVPEAVVCVAAKDDSGRPSMLREPVLIDPEIDESGFQQWRSNSMRVSALDEVAQDVIGLDGRALAQIAIH